MIEEHMPTIIGFPTLNFAANLLMSRLKAMAKPITMAANYHAQQQYRAAAALMLLHIFLILQLYFSIMLITFTHLRYCNTRNIAPDITGYFNCC